MLEAVYKIGVRCAWFPAAVFGAHVFFSRVLNAYESYPPLDIPMHFAGGVAIAYFFWRSLDVLEELDLIQSSHGVLRFIVVFGLSSTATVIWEFAEFISDQLFDTGAQKGLEDTMFDMFLGMVGASAYLSLCIVWPAHFKRAAKDAE